MSGQFGKYKETFREMHHSSENFREKTLYSKSKIKGLHIFGKFMACKK